MEYAFEWDPAKSEINARKHRVTFEEAATAFYDPFSITIPDPEHSFIEDRFILVGRTWRDLIVLVAHVERRGIIRIISARRASLAERRTYEEGQS